MIDRKIALIPGNGLVLAVGTVVAVVHRDAVADSEELGSFLQICREAGLKGDPSPGAGLARRVGRLLLDGEAAQFPAFSIVAPAGDELLILVHGAITVVVTDRDELANVAGADEEDWTERRFPNSVERVQVGPRIDAAAPDLWTDLREGIAPGAGFVITYRVVEAVALQVASETPFRPTEGMTDPDVAAAVPIQAEVPVVAPELDILPEEIERPSLLAPMFTPAATESMPTSGGASSDYQVITLVGIDTTSALAGRMPLPLEGSAEIEEVVVDDVDPYEVVVEGIRCVRNHHNNPAAQYCSRCGIKMVVRAQELVEGTRPPLGVMTLDDSSTYPVMRDMVLGREPGIDDLVRDDRALGITINDEKRTVSRAHASIHLDGWDAYIVDRESANGTFVRTSTMQPWQRLVPGERVALVTGMSVRIGEREFAFDQHHLVG